VHSCSLTANGGHGLYVKGADANAGAGYNINASYNGGWGIYDSSFLGNTYVACHTAVNTLGSYKSDNANARNLFLGCYSEGGQPAGSIVAPAMFIGGLNDISGPGLLSGLIVPLYTSVGFGAPTIYLGVNQSYTSGVGLSFPDTGGTYPWTFGKATGRWGYQWANLGSPYYFMFYDRTATPQTDMRVT